MVFFLVGFGGAGFGLAVEAFFGVTFFLAEAFFAVEAFFLATFFFAEAFFAGEAFFLVTFFAVVLRRAGAFEVFFLGVADALRVVFFATVENPTPGGDPPNCIRYSDLRAVSVAAGWVESREDT